MEIEKKFKLKEADYIDRIALENKEKLDLKNALEN
jgi:hypothetical protein